VAFSCAWGQLTIFEAITFCYHLIGMMNKQIT